MEHTRSKVYLTLDLRACRRSRRLGLLLHRLIHGRRIVLRFPVNMIDIISPIIWIINFLPARGQNVALLPISGAVLLLRLVARVVLAGLCHGLRRDIPPHPAVLLHLRRNKVLVWIAAVLLVILRVVDFRGGGPGGSSGPVVIRMLIGGGRVMRKVVGAPICLLLLTERRQEILGRCEARAAAAAGRERLHIGAIPSTFALTRGISAGTDQVGDESLGSPGLDRDVRRFRGSIEITWTKNTPPKNDSRHAPPKNDSRHAPPKNDSRHAPPKNDSRCAPPKRHVMP